MILSSTMGGCIHEEVRGEQDIPSTDEILDEESQFTEHCIEYDDLERCWLLLVPMTLNESSTVPLVVDIHGGEDDMYQQRWTSDFANISMEQGFIVAYPQGHNNLWNMGWDSITCSAGILCTEEDDVGFILQMVDTITQNHSIDNSRIYSTGWSNGCGMTQRLAVEASEVFAAAGCMAMYRFVEPPQTTHPSHSWKFMACWTRLFNMQRQPIQRSSLDLKKEPFKI